MLINFYLGAEAASETSRLLDTYSGTSKRITEFFSKLFITVPPRRRRGEQAPPLDIDGIGKASQAAISAYMQAIDAISQRPVTSSRDAAFAAGVVSQLIIQLRKLLLESGDRDGTVSNLLDHLWKLNGLNVRRHHF